jgi:predicted transcriptional regulator
LRKLISADAVYCAECGAKFKSLKRHLGTEHNLTPHAYIQKWGLKPDHPMVAPNYSATRSALAKSMGLGSGGRKAAVAPVKANKAPAKTVAPVPSKPARRGKAVAAGADSASK